ncbi:MAG: DsbA family protein [Pseudomonadota bacterium]|nr:DsbA family protein [Pseudomonadota bacterium]
MFQGLKLILVLVSGLLTANVATAAVVTGNANSNVTVVEFFDYQCPHCRIMSRNVEQAVSGNQNVKVVTRVIPVMDGSSWYIARAALAARKQHGYHKFNSLLMQESGYISKERTVELAKIAGLNINNLERDMHSPDISSELNSNLRASQAEGVTVVPATFVSYKSANRPATKIIGDRSVNYLQDLFR